MRKRSLALGAAAALILGAVGGCVGPQPRPPRGAVVFTVDGRVEGGTYRFGEDDLPALPRRAVRAAPPGRDPARYEGVDVLALLAEDVSLAADADLAVFHGDGGRVAAVPLALLQQAGPILATGGDRRGAGGLALVWPTLDQPGLETDPRLRGLWLTGVDRIELQRWSATWGRALAVPAGAGDAARRGAGVVGSACLGCHQLRGVGGRRGPPLGLPRAAAGSGPSPERLRAHAAAVGAAPARPAAAFSADLGDAAAFLAAVARAPPQEEPPAEPAGEAPAAPRTAVPLLPGASAAPGAGEPRSPR